jgi:hypothetical protein
MIIHYFSAVYIGVRSIFEITISVKIIPVKPCIFEHLNRFFELTRNCPPSKYLRCADNTGIGKNMPADIIIYGKRLFSKDWEKARSEMTDQYHNIAVCSDPIIPEIDSSEGTIYVDLEKENFRKPQFLKRLPDNFRESTSISATRESPVSEFVRRVDS